MTRLRLLRAGDVSPARAMAVDEALLTLAAAPTLRLYRWQPHGVSIGYFQRWRDLPWERLEAEGIPIVRRLTGGGAIFHGDEVTFSLVAPSNHAFFEGTVRESYDRVHSVLARALETRCPAGVRVAPRGGAELHSDVGGSPWCFHESTPFDLTAAARKLAGSAQRRASGRVLHHGSLVLRSNRFTPEIASVEALGGDPSPAALEGAVAAAFAEATEMELDEGSLSPAESALALALEEGKYSTDSWNRRR